MYVYLGPFLCKNRTIHVRGTRYRIVFGLWTGDGMISLALE